MTTTTISTYPRLTHFEELDLLKQYKSTDDKRLLDKLVLANLGLCHKIVHKFPLKNASVSYDDLFQEAVAGLIHGIQKYEAERGVRLSTYVYNWIRAYVQRYFANHSRAVRIPIHISDAQYALNKQVETLTRELQRTPTIEEISAINPDARSIIADMRAGVSLNATIGDDTELMDIQSPDNADVREESLELSLMLDNLAQNATKRDMDILMRRFGLNGYTPHTLQEVAETHKLTRSRVHQIETRLVSQLKQMA